MFKNIIFLIGSIFLFLSGVIGYGFILHLSEPTISEVMDERGINYLTNVHILVDRKNYRLDLYSDTLLLKSYRAVFGKKSSLRGVFSGENGTPNGSYEICSIDTNSRYSKFLKINFPNITDAREALKLGKITRDEYNIIYISHENNECPFIKNKLPEIGIQGIGKLNFIFKNLPFVYNWTNGSIAVSNENIDEIYSVTNIGTKIVIKN